MVLSYEGKEIAGLRAYSCKCGGGCRITRNGRGVTCQEPQQLQDTLLLDITTTATIAPEIYKARTFRSVHLIGLLFNSVLFSCLDLPRVLVMMWQPSSTVVFVASLLAALPVSADGIYTKKSPVLQVNYKTYNQLIADSNHTSVSDVFFQRFNSVPDTDQH